MKKILLVVDIQKEYITQGRPFYINGINKNLRNAKKVLEYAREHEWEIIHVVQFQDGEVFSPKSEYSQVVNGFEPKSGEVVYIKNKLSCYTNKYFSQYFERLKDREIVIIGCSLADSITPIISSSYQTKNRFILVKDTIENEEIERVFGKLPEVTNEASRFISIEEVV